MWVRSKYWRERVVLKEFSDKEWKENFRMTGRTFDKLCGLMLSIMKPEDVTMHAPVPLQMRVAIMLYKLASCSEYRVVAKQFGVHKSTVRKFVYIFCKGMVSSVIQSFIKVPTAEEAIAIARHFEQKFNTPQIIGCIDCTHIPVLPPSDAYKDFANHKGWPSYVLQAVVDDTYWFWNINCKLPGSAHDANILRQSALLSHAHLLPKGPREISGVAVNHFLVGDTAYPLLDWLIKGDTHYPRITPVQESFNVDLSSARTTVGLAFGRLKSRWHVLLKRNDFHAALESDLPQPGVHAYNASDNAGGQRIREALTDYLSANFPLIAPKL
ncbi:Protein ALP1-like [Nibea albiflora]|uniref:Protein ALP1-like n=1 Tax=Nibea albiflora TaxID=240163 RepID=A0ACB7FE66_NIBAL|nr:Protein ALP1-like [Nibea albiflora]